MTYRLGWTIAVIATAIVLTGVVALEGDATWRLIGVASVHLVLVVSWLIFGPRALTNPGRALPLAIAFIALATFDTYFSATMATVQCIVFPLIWALVEPLRRVIALNIVLSALVGAAEYLGNGATSTAFVVAVIIQAISLAFSIALGLWITSIATKSDERRRLLDELEATQDRLAVLSRESGAASERERLALEIHDTIAQDLAGLVMTAQRGRRELSGGNASEVEHQLVILEEIARQALAETRALVAGGAAVGPDGGLAASLGRLGDRYTRETGMTVTITADAEVELDRDAEVVLLRCAQEALANVRKHAGAMHACVTLARKGDDVELTVADDGAGFDTATSQRGFGLDGMRERLALADGALVLDSAPGRGTTLIATLPSAREVLS
jgi:signal transduction histidine kinase